MSDSTFEPGHKKSRKGCKQCRRKHVKCDERIPCGRCVRRKEECDLLVPQRLASEDSLTQESVETLNRLIYVMHHYTLYTADSLIDNAEIQRLWKYVFPEEALRHPFLTQGLLAISALHLTSTRPIERLIWTPLALKHQSRALQLFRATLPCVNQENCHAQFALSILISVTSMAFCSYGTALGPGQSLPINDVTEAFTLIRGVGELLSVATEWLTAGPLSTILTTHFEDAPENSATNRVIDLSPIKNLSRMVQEMCPDLDVQRDLYSSIHILEYVYSQVLKGQGREIGKNPGVGWQWPSGVSPGYTALLLDSHGGALVIYAHFSLLSYTWRDKWYLNGWAERSIAAIVKHLSSEWLQWVEWPIEQVKNGFPIFKEE
ncbi:hypothetical protein BT63DRAFT_401003 [Microthyrium microscopicum]|uniref:Zn(2)-C6 fungal-type domain-containing protein n=1 Tax=Microthyrium microscopicum TaxID=703497 RepID=A0A6A6UET3_9PEZI|nr:hypothetical protein BT63DRAFT_401003 [Microthyrium microscopicum]